MAPLVSYYGKEVDAGPLKGWRGFVIRVYGRIIARLQRAIEWHLLHILARDQGLAPDNVADLERRFELSHVRGAKRVIHDLLKTADEPTRADRYKDSRRPERSEPSFAPYLAPGRSKRYARGRLSRLADPDGDVIEPVPKANFRGDPDED